MNIRMCTDPYEFGAITKKKCSRRGSFITNKHKYIHKTTPTSYFSSMFLGSADIKNSNVYINLKKCISISDLIGLNIIHTITETVKHEVLHCEIYKILGETNTTDEPIIIKHFDSIQTAFEKIRKKQKTNKKIMYG